MSYLTESDRYNLDTKTATLSSKNILICDPTKTAPKSNDIFSFRSSKDTRANPRELAEVAIALAESCDTTTQGVSFESDPVAFQVTMTESQIAGFQGCTGINSQGQPKTSYTNLQVAIQAVQVPDRSNISLWSLAILGIVAQIARRK